MESDVAADESGDSGVHRLHPLSLLFRVGGSIKLVLVPLLLVVFAGGDDGEPWWVALFVLPGLVHSVVHYLTYRYRFQGDELVVRGGLLFRNERHIPYARIQNVDMTQGPLHRLFRVADVRIETAGGAEPEARLQVLSLAALDAMRERVFANSGTEPSTAVAFPGVAESTQDGASAPVAPSASGAASSSNDSRESMRAHATDASGPEPAGADALVSRGADLSRGSAPEPLLRLGLRELVLFGIISNRGMAVVLAALGLTHEFGLFERIDPEDSFWQELAPAWDGGLANVLAGVGFVAAVIVALRLLSIVWALLYLGGFQLTRHGDDLRSHAGLLTRVSTTIPRRRIQVVTLRETLLHRLFGRVAVTVDTAGGDSLERAKQSTRRWLAPLLPRADVAALLRAVQPGLEVDRVAWQPVHPAAARRLARRWWLFGVLAAGGMAAWLALGGAGGLAARPLASASAVAAVALLIGVLGRLDARARARRLGWSVEQGAVWIRHGVWTRTVRVVRDEKAQVVAVQCSPFDRRWGMARLVVDAAGCDEPVSQALLPGALAEALRARLIDRVGTTAFRW